VVTFTAMVAMSRAEFTADKQDAYVGGVAQALSVTPARVAIASITDQPARRRLLAAEVAVETTATVFAPRSAVPCLSASSQRGSSLLKTYWSGSTDVFGGPASRHRSLNPLFQVALYLPS
jgi:hypothetical protein